MNRYCCVLSEELITCSECGRCEEEASEDLTRDDDVSIWGYDGDCA